MNTSEYEIEGDEEKGNFVNCDICDLPIDLDQEDYHSGHRERCPNYGLEELEFDCECSIFYHPHCCPICLNEEKVIREYEQHQH